ncbi:Cathepsin L [Balamuthia mandrillaris]
MTGMLLRLAVVALVAATLLVAAAEAKPKTQWFELEEVGYSFDDFVREYQPRYASPEEHAMRQKLFESRLSEIKAHNRDPTKTWKMGVNHLTDRTAEEQRALLGYDKSVGHTLRQSRRPPVWSAPLGVESLPSRVDWREQGIVSPVKDQGKCGSCWTFAAAETLESAYAKKTGQLFTLSEQQILDCTPNPDECGGTGGCHGGTVELAYTRLVAFEQGLATEWTYPYTSYFGEAFQCRFNASRTKVAAKVGSYVVIPSNKYTPLLQAVATLGPIAISVDASTWHNYEGGVYDGCNQTNPDINHAVQLVGYGTDEKTGQDYWLVRNSWGPAWGENGYIRVKRQSNPTCGIDLTPRVRLPLLHFVDDQKY